MWTPSCCHLTHWPQVSQRLRKEPQAAWALSPCSDSALTYLPFTLETRCPCLTWWKGLCLQSQVLRSWASGKEEA